MTQAVDARAGLVAAVRDCCPRRSVFGPLLPCAGAPPLLLSRLCVATGQVHVQPMRHDQHPARQPACMDQGLGLRPLRWLQRHSQGRTLHASLDPGPIPDPDPESQPKLSAGLGLTYPALDLFFAFTHMLDLLLLWLNS